jgi:hypothetical protein
MVIAVATRCAMLRAFTLRAFTLCAFALCALPGMTSAQTVKKGVLAGLVRDSSGVGIGDATITVLDANTGEVRQKGHTVFNGRFAIPGLEPGIPYTVKVAKFDYYLFVTDSVVIPSTNVLRVEYIMYPDEARKLARQTIKAPPKGSKLARKTLEWTEIAEAKVHSALDAIQRLRPIMLMPNRDICMTGDSLSLYVDGVRRPVYNPTDDGFGARRLVTRQGNNRGQFYITGRTNEEIVEDELRQIPAEDIAEVKFVSCDDYDNKILKRNVIWLLTKRYKQNSSNER